MKCSCIYCRREYSVKGIFVHVDRSHLHQQQYSSGNNGCYDQVTATKKEHLLAKKKLYKIAPNTCKQCHETLTYDKQHNTFCSRSCSAMYSNSRKDYSTFKTGPEPKPRYTKVKWLMCSDTGKYYCNRDSNGRIRKLSPYVDRKLARRKSYKGNKKLYDFRQECLFKFNVYDYPAEFDTSLVDQHGWYRPTNRGNNLTGVSRDHMVSVKHGFEHNVDPAIISHPANCQLITHSDNASKCANSSITISELIKRIKIWESKY